MELSLRAIHAGAIREVNARFSELDPEAQERVEILADDEIENLIAEGDRALTLKATKSWKSDQLAEIESCA